MNNLNPVATYALRLGDNGLVLAQRLGAWCGHAPELEIDLALANIGLDLLGQARNFLSYAAELAGSGDEDTLAYGRDERQYGNLLLVEQPNGNFADTIARQFFIDAWHVALFTRLVNSRDAQIAAIAAKGLKEVRYHLRFSRGWLERLGNGTEVSAQKMQQAVDGLWRFTGELFLADALELALVEQGIAVDPRDLQAEWQSTVHTALLDAGLQIPQEAAFRHGGKQGLHSEHLGPLLAEMQYLQRAYPGQQWYQEVAMLRLADIAPAEVHAIWALLSEIPDPEVPVLTITDLGMVRSVAPHGEGWVIGFTPTYSGCPATEHLLGEIRATMARHGYTPVHVVLQLDPPWTTDWMNQDARERLRQYGISPPQGHACHAGLPQEVVCPRCGSVHTTPISEFGSTACKALYRCDSCREPFDYFKCI